jgi:Bacterial Ig-like domain
MGFVQRGTWIVGLAALAVAACTGSGVGLDANGNPIPPGGGGGGEPLTPDFKSIQDNVFTPICTKCHIGAGAPEGLQLDAAHSYALLVGVPSTEQPNVLRVKAGDPDNSYIVQKLEGAASISGARMPFGGPYLPQSTIDVIRTWITNGAQPASTQASAAAAQHHAGFAVEVTAPEEGAVVVDQRPTIVVAFNHEVDASLVNYTTVMLERTETTPAVAVATTTALAAGNPRVLLITPRAPLAPGSYRVTLRGSGGGALADVGAETLSAGADHSFNFVVDFTR